MEGLAAEPWKTLVLLTLFLLFVTISGFLTLTSFVPEKSASSEALRSVVFALSVLFMYNLIIWGWSIASPERVWICWVWFAVVTALYLVVAGLCISNMRRRPPKTSASPAAGKEDRGS